MEKLLKRSREMQEKQDRELAATIVRAKVAGGKIAGKMDAHRALLSIDIDPELIRAGRRELLEEKIMELVNKLADRVDYVLEDRFGIIDQMPMPDVSGLFDRRS
jgi:DNA-binding protein YbaB